MGQYYHPIIVGENKKTVKAWMYSHDYGSGLKLMEHSWLKNPFVKAFETLIFGKPQRVVWAGDYADECKGNKTNLYQRCKDSLKVNPKAQLSDVNTRYVVNHTKKEFVDKTKTPNMDGWRIHPLPLLCADGNGRGGGDYRETNGAEFIGTWARDLISVERLKPKGFKEITPNFFE